MMLKRAMCFGHVHKCAFKPENDQFEDNNNVITDITACLTKNTNVRVQSSENRKECPVFMFCGKH